MDHLNTFTEFQADLISFTVSPGKIETNTLEHPELNTFHHFKSRVCCKSAEAAFYVFGENRDMLSQNISNLVSAALKTTISLGNSDLIWRAVLTKYSTEETGIDCYSQVELSFDVMESLPLTTVKLKGNDTILNAGNCTSECIISFTPTKETTSFPSGTCSPSINRKSADDRHRQHQKNRHRRWGEYLAQRLPFPASPPSPPG